MFRYLYFFSVMVCREMLQIKHYIHICVSYLEFFCFVVLQKFDCPALEQHTHYQTRVWNIVKLPIGTIQATNGP